MFSFLRRKRIENDVIFPPITIPLTNIQAVDEAGILYLDNEGNSANIHYYDAYKGWCKSKSVKKSKLKYICDRTKLKDGSSSFILIPKSLFIQIQVKKSFGLRFSIKSHYKGFEVLTGISFAPP